MKIPLISLLVSIVFNMNLASCGFLPASPTIMPTVTATLTFILTPIPTPTLAYPLINDQTLQELGLALDDVKIVWQDEDGNWFAGEKVGDRQLSLNVNNEWVLAVEPIKEFPWCKDMTQFEQCPIEAADLQEQGRFAQSTLTAELFDPTQLKIITAYSVVQSPGANYLVPNIETAPNYRIVLFSG